MKNHRETKDQAVPTPYQYAPDTPDKNTSLEDKVLTVVSLGTIISGGLACLASVGIGMSLVLLGTMVFAEL